MSLTSRDYDLEQLEKLGGIINTRPFPSTIEETKGTSNPNSQGSGMKYDGGKLLANILFQDFPNALKAVLEIGTFGARKYARNSWLTVPDAQTRYADALVRHQIEIGRGVMYDEESDLLHAAHFAWNALAVLELMLRSGVDVRNPKQQGNSLGTNYIPEIH